MVRSDIFIILLAGIIHATLQLGVGALLLLYHASLGKHVRKKTRELASNYILGNAFLTLLAVPAAAFMIGVVFQGQMNPGTMTIAIGILAALAISVWAFYFRLGKSTELWLPKSIAKFINKRAELTESKTEAFSLGMLACFAEAPFTFMLVIVSANSIVALPLGLQILMIFVYVLLSILPLAILRIAVRKGETVVDIQKWRLRNKKFLRVVSGVGFLVLALFLLAFKVIGVA